MKRVIEIHLLALRRKARAAYWSIETPDEKFGALRLRAERLGLRVSEKFPRLVYNPEMTSETEVDEAFDDPSKDSRPAGRLLGYPDPGADFSQWWVDWTVRKPGSIWKYDHLFHFQMKKLDGKKLVDMKKRWNRLMPEHYFDFKITYRENGTASDMPRA